jgi:hypothetical protein
VVQLHDLFGDVGFEGIVGVGEGWERALVCHGVGDVSLDLDLELVNL